MSQDNPRNTVPYMLGQIDSKLTALMDAHTEVLKKISGHDISIKNLIAFQNQTVGKRGFVGFAIATAFGMLGSFIASGLFNGFFHK